MKAKLASTAAIVCVLGCAPRASGPAPVMTAPPPVRVAAPPTPVVLPPKPPVIAVVEPYLVSISALRYPAPPTLRGDILPDTGLPSAPLEPLPPPRTTPVTPPNAVQPVKPPPTKPVPPKGSDLSPAIVRLFEEERSRHVDDARQRLAAATARAAQAATEAKRLWGFVKDGFVAQKQAENADASARAATNEQAQAQKALDEAVQRQRDARRDLEAALKRVAALHGVMTRLARLPASPSYFQAVPDVYRLAVLGSGPVTISLQNGTVDRRLTPGRGEAGAWMVRTPDPTKLRVGVGARPARVIVRTLPIPEAGSKVRSSV